MSFAGTLALRRGGATARGCAPLHLGTSFLGSFRARRCHHVEGAAHHGGTAAAGRRLQGDLQTTDWQTAVTRRASQKPAQEGGSNMFCVGTPIDLDQ